MAQPSPKDRFITVYGRKPVLEALEAPGLVVDKILLADGVRGQQITGILTAARARGVPTRRVTAHRVKQLAGNGKQDQGVCADVVAPRMRTLAAGLAAGLDGPVLVLDGVTTPANVGMILRSATAAGVSGIVVPRRGVASLDPLVVKASAGVAFVAPVLTVGAAEEAVVAVREHGLPVVGLHAAGAETVFTASMPRTAAYIVGGETGGISDPIRALVDDWVRIPMAAEVESLNVAAAAAVLCFELTRRGHTGAR